MCMLPHLTLAVATVIYPQEDPDILEILFKSLYEAKEKIVQAQKYTPKAYHPDITAFTTWFTEHGGVIHSDLHIKKTHHGLGFHTKGTIEVGYFLQA